MSLEDLLGLRTYTAAASLFVESSLEAASTIDVVTEQQWERRGARYVLDAINHLPATMIYNSFSGRVPMFRGYAGRTNPGVAVMLDGVPINEQLLGPGFIRRPFVLDTLSRIEVIRGPGSAVYGSDAFHGVVSMHSYAPTENRYEAGEELGSDLYSRGFARLSHGLGNLRLNVATGFRGIRDQDETFYYLDGMGQRQSAERADGWRSLQGTAELAYKTERVDADVGFTGMNGKLREAPGFGYSLAPVNLAGPNDSGDADSEFRMVRARAGFHLGQGVKLEASGYYWLQDDDSQLANSGNAATDLAIGVEQHRYGARLTVQQDDTDKLLQWMAGYEFTKSEVTGAEQMVVDRASGDILTPPAARTDPAEGFGRDIHSLLLSGQVKVFSKYLKLSLGGRAEHYSDFGVQVSPRAGIIGLPAEGVAVKLLYGRAFRAPAARENRGTSQPVAPNSKLEPELIDTLELVFQRESTDWTLNLTGFGSMWTNGILVRPLESPEPPLTARFENAGKSRSAGAEASAVYATTEFRLDTSASYVRSELLVDGGPDMEYTAFPQLIFNLGAGYTVRPLGLDFYVAQRWLQDMTEGLSPRAAMGAADITRRLDPYYRVDLHLSWAAIAEKLWLFANVRNVFAIDNYLPSTFDAPGGNQDAQLNASFGVRGSI